VKALAVASEKDRQALFRKAIQPLSREPSLHALGLEDWLMLGPREWRPLVEQLSSGHKLVLHIIVRLVSHLQPNSLVLMDEPESHLHPPLLSALIRSVNVALSERQSIGVIATHSPVVLQEIPRRFVSVIERIGDATELRQPVTETFGENVSILTKEVFNLDNSRSDYRRVLRRLAGQRSVEDIVELFDGQISSQALSYLSTYLANRD
jgi:ABC-type multidrug transport system ATPase subunit